MTLKDTKHIEINNGNIILYNTVECVCVHASILMHCTIG